MPRRKNRNKQGKKIDISDIIPETDTIVTPKSEFQKVKEKQSRVNNSSWNNETEKGDPLSPISNYSEYSNKQSLSVNTFNANSQYYDDVKKISSDSYQKFGLKEYKNCPGFMQRPIDDAIEPVKNFLEMDFNCKSKGDINGESLDTTIKKALNSTYASNPTSCQTIGIPVLQKGYNLFLQSHTGTGKTDIFMTHGLSNIELETDKPNVLILCHGRNAASQAYSRFCNMAGFFRKYSKDVPKKKKKKKKSKVVDFRKKSSQKVDLKSFNKNRILLAVGENKQKGERVSNFTIKRDIKNLRVNKPKVVIGTLGRIGDLIKKGELDLSEVRFITFDEYDEIHKQVHTITELQEQGMADEENFFVNTYYKINEIIDKLSKQSEPVQTMYCSATIENEILEKFLNSQNYIITLKDGVSNLENIMQTKIPIDLLSLDYNPKYYAEIISDIKKNSGFINKVLIFVNNKKTGFDIKNYLRKLGVTQTESICSNESTEVGQKIINNYRNNKIEVLITTNMLSRAMDISDIDIVINIGLPREQNGDQVYNTYQQRIGRTGRCYKPGIALTIYDSSNQNETNLLKQIEKKNNSKIIDFPKNGILKQEYNKFKNKF